MQKVDFIFVYEIKLREIESICLLKYELEKRGYSIGIVNTWSSIGKAIEKRDAEVVVAFAAYDDAMVNFITSHVGQYRKILNMQWEQLLLIKEDDKAEERIRENAKRIWHISWGERNRSELLYGSKVDAENIKMVGHIGMDFLREEFRGFYCTKHELEMKYNLPLGKKVCLFISSFVYVDMPQSCMSEEEKKMVNTAKESQRVIIEWMKRLVEEEDDIVVVYRPHPAERDSELLERMKSLCPHFRVISELSVKQWILVADYIMTWYSTSIAEIFFAKKDCCILRPLEIPKYLDCSIFENANFINTYYDLKCWLKRDKKEFPVSESEVLINYANDSIPTYKKIVEVLIQLYKSNKDDSQLFSPSLMKRLYNKCKSVIYRMIMKLGVTLGLKMSNKKQEEEADDDFNTYVKEMSAHNTVTDYEIDLIISQLKKVLDSTEY